MTKETWYVLEDGSVADPAKCVPGEDGALAFEGVKVARRGDVYHSRSVDPKNLPAKPKVEAKEVKPEEPKTTYKTRESKAK